jgi:hypothetical protein
MDRDPVVPNDRACLSHRRQKGGTAAGIKKVAYDWIEEKYQMARDEFTLRASQDTFLQKLTGDYSANQEVVRNQQRITRSQNRIYRVGPRPEEALEAARWKLAKDTEPPQMKPLAIPELGGKVRLATIHSAEEVYFARNVTRRWLSQLRKVVTTKDMLRGREVRLEALENGELFSADLSAATDNIPHELAQHVARQLCRRMNEDYDEEQLILKTLGPHRLPDGTITSNGIHMGLGPTWVILSLLNGFAAWHAGANKSDHRICGDDLIGLWSRTRAERYTRTLESLGLVVNHSKSFHTAAGVFCERIVERTEWHVAVAKDVGHISHSAASRVNSGRTSDRFSVAESLWALPHIPRLSRQTAQGLSPRLRHTGPIRLGGKGTGIASLWQLAAAVKERPINLVKADDLIPQAIRAQVHESSQLQGDVKVSDLLVHMQTRIRLGKSFKGKRSNQVRSITQKDIKQKTRSRRHKFSKTSISDLRRSVRSSPLNSKTRKTLLHVLRTRSLSHKEVAKRVQRLVSRRPAERFVDRHTANLLLESASPVPWGLDPVRSDERP